MKRRIPHIVSLAVITGILAMAPNITHAQTTDPLLANSIDQSLFPQITSQPLDHVVPIGSNVVLSMEANNANACQWLKDGVPMTGQANNTPVIPPPFSPAYQFWIYFTNNVPASTNYPLVLTGISP